MYPSFSFLPFIYIVTLNVFISGSPFEDIHLEHFCQKFITFERGSFSEVYLNLVLKIKLNAYKKNFPFCRRTSII